MISTMPCPSQRPWDIPTERYETPSASKIVSLDLIIGSARVGSPRKPGPGGPSPASTHACLVQDSSGRHDRAPSSSSAAEERAPREPAIVRPRGRTERRGPPLSPFHPTPLQTWRPEPRRQLYFERSTEPPPRAVASRRTAGSEHGRGTNPRPPPPMASHPRWSPPSTETPPPRRGRTTMRCWRGRDRGGRRRPRRRRPARRDHSAPRSDGAVPGRRSATDDRRLPTTRGEMLESGGEARGGAIPAPSRLPEHRRTPVFVALVASSSPSFPPATSRFRPSLRR
mmetsp:Transcript_3648/g.9819  ORF Transcript_3648/g.9819 Transcript_3648/m.9819 type:complete len:283 (-) Transcript_3648:503-1351(-)